MEKGGYAIPHLRKVENGLSPQREPRVPAGLKKSRVPTFDNNRWSNFFFKVFLFESLLQTLDFYFLFHLGSDRTHLRGGVDATFDPGDGEHALLHRHRADRIHGRTRPGQLSRRAPD